MKFQCRIHGIDPDKKRQSSSQTKEQQGSGQQENAVPLFKDPSEYEHMTQEKREELTRQMMGPHRNWAGKKSMPLGG